MMVRARGRFVPKTSRRAAVPPEMNRNCIKGEQLACSLCVTIQMIKGQVVEEAAEEPVELVPGSRIGGYQIMRLLGRGARASVYQARSLTMDELVAIKVIKVTAGREVKRFQRQGRICARLVHQNIVRMNAFGTQESICFCVMEYVVGETLQAILQRGVLSAEQFLYMFVQVAEAIGYAHDRQVLHRDIKPANLMVAKSTASGSSIVKVVDFGLAALFEADEVLPVDHESTTTTGTMKGSPAYMSPEQCRSEKLDARSDIYSLGCTMYESLVGRLPFKANTVYELMMKQINDPAVIPPECQIPPVLQKVILRCLAKKPEDRYQSITELLSELTVIDPETPSAFIGGRATSGSRKVGTAALIGFTLLAVILLTTFNSHKRSLVKSPPDSRSETDLFKSKGEFRLDKTKYYQGLQPIRLLELSYRKSVDDPEHLMLRRMVCEAAIRQGDLKLLIDAQTAVVEHFRRDTKATGSQKEVDALLASLSKPEASEVPKILRARAYYQIYEYYYANRALKEARHNCEVAMELMENSSDILALQQYARACETLGRCFCQMGDQARAIRCYRKVIQLCEDRLTRNRCNMLIAISALLTNDKRTYQTALKSIDRPLDEETVTALELSRLGSTMLDTGHFEEGKRITREAIEMFEHCGSNWYEDRAAALSRLSLISLNEQELVLAEQYCQEGLDLVRLADSGRAAKVREDLDRLHARIIARGKKKLESFSLSSKKG